MTIRTTGLVALAITTWLDGSILAVGIKETAKLTVFGATLQQPIEIIEPSLLARSNVFAGSFIAGSATEPDATWIRYSVAFDVQTLDGVKTSAYVVHYCADPNTGDGYVYLPGRGDFSYRRNVSTILRTGQDGRWHRASDEWSAAINAYLN